MDLIAHRGFAAERAENTVPALRRAAEIADAVEFDVRRCASGDPVVVHDETVDRVTGESGPVAGFAADELAEMDVLGSGAGIPTLGTVLDALPETVPLHVELKEAGLADAVLDALADHESRAILASFDAGTLREVRDVNPDVPLGCIAGDLRDRPVARAVELDCDAVMVRSRLAALPSVRRATRRLDLALTVWTVNARPTALALAGLGVDGITSDRSDVLPGRR